MHDPRIFIDWLAATEHVKNINQAWFTALAFAWIFAKHWQCDVSEVMGSTRRDHFETMRRAKNSFGHRCILGVAAMVARDTRLFHTVLDNKDYITYIFLV